MNAVYKPTATGRPATDAYAIALGRTTAAAVSPATRSKRKVDAFGALAGAGSGDGDIAFAPGGLYEDGIAVAAQLTVHAPRRFCADRWRADGHFTGREAAPGDS